MNDDSLNALLFRIREILATVPDPEVPAISVVDLGIIRDVRFDAGVARIVITPTYSGCPAMRVIEDTIRSALFAAGFDQVEITVVLAPAWTTDWLSAAGREKLRAYGITPPQPAETALVNIGFGACDRKPTPIPCPFCTSTNTRLRSEFGPTACKALYSCNACLQPFEYFKPF